jgi:hypothetical protein
MLAAVQPAGQEIDADAGREKHERGADERQELDAVHGCSFFKRSLGPQSSRWTRSFFSCHSCASIDIVAIGRASRRRSEIGSPVTSQ